MINVKKDCQNSNDFHEKETPNAVEGCLKKTAALLAVRGQDMKNFEKNYVIPYIKQTNFKTN